LLIFGLGWHWALLQTVAWSGMLIRYSRVETFQSALSKTFDGKHPCALCKVVQQGRSEEQNQDPQTPQTSKLDFAILPVSGIDPAPLDFPRIEPAVQIAERRVESPPKPRPRDGSLLRVSQA
jgi:hypothetical protein